MFFSNKDGSKKLTLSPVKSFVQAVFIPICVFVISLGSFSEAFILVGDFRNMMKSRFSNDFEYKTLSAIHVGNTVNYVEGKLGAPAATKSLDNGVLVNYYIHEKYLLSGYFKGDRVAAYTVVAIVDGFSPEMTWYQGLRLGESPFSEFSESPQGFTFDNAKTNRFFIELSPNELSGFFQNSYLGVVQYGMGEVDQESLNGLYNSDVFGTEEETIEKIGIFRQKGLPNFYGQGELDIEVIQKGLLSNGEFLNFFGT
ncbi:MAG: hypothetical protein ACI93R_000422 [Flavobacteriales bacterium]|jgi:hypothetical protein